MEESNEMFFKSRATIFQVEDDTKYYDVDYADICSPSSTTITYKNIFFSIYKFHSQWAGINKMVGLERNRWFYVPLFNPLFI